MVARARRESFLKVGICIDVEWLRNNNWLLIARSGCEMRGPLVAEMFDSIQADFKGPASQDWSFYER